MDLWKIIIIIILIIVIIFGIVNIFFKTDVLYDYILDCASDNEVITNLEKESSANMSFSMWYFVNDFQTNYNNKNFLTYYNDDPTDSTMENHAGIAYINKEFDSNYSETSLTKVFDNNTLVCISNSNNNFETLAQDMYDQADIDSANCPANHKILTSDQCNFPTLHVCLNSNRNDIHIFVRTSNTAQSKVVMSRFVIKNVPLQKWCNLSLTVDNNVFDVYLDGKLHNSFILPDTLYTRSNNTDSNKIYLNGIDGNTTHNTFLTRIRYINRAITTTEAYDIYKSGISSKHATSIFNKYNLKISFLEYNQEKSSFMF